MVKIDAVDIVETVAVRSIPTDQADIKAKVVQNLKAQNAVKVVILTGAETTLDALKAALDVKITALVQKANKVAVTFNVS
jgi:hypothetical protein